MIEDEGRVRENREEEKKMKMEKKEKEKKHDEVRKQNFQKKEKPKQDSLKKNAKPCVVSFVAAKRNRRNCKRWPKSPWKKRKRNQQSRVSQYN